MIRSLTMFMLVSLCNCVTKHNSKVYVDSSKIKPFEIKVTDSDYSMAYGIQYVLTERNLRIIYKGGLKGEKDSVIYATELNNSKTLNALSDINLDNLEGYYTNPCIQDGSQITIDLKKENQLKTVHVSNYYQNEIGLAIEFINELSPEKYKIWYDKESLIEKQEKCK